LLVFLVIVWVLGEAIVIGLCAIAIRERNQFLVFQKEEDE